LATVHELYPSNADMRDYVQAFIAVQVSLQAS
jgi:hypothetical protein